MSHKALTHLQVLKVFCELFLKHFLHVIIIIFAILYTLYLKTEKLGPKK